MLNAGARAATVAASATAATEVGERRILVVSASGAFIEKDGLDWTIVQSAASDHEPHRP